MTDRLRVPVHYDFASTICYVAHRATQRLAPRLEALGIELLWTPLDLSRLAGRARGVPVPALARENAERVAAELDVPTRVPTVWLDSRALHAAVLSAENAGRDPAALRERVWCAVFEERTAPESPEAARALAREAEAPVDEAGLLAGLAELDSRTRAAAEAGVTGVPTFVLGGWPFGGIQDDASMERILARFAERARAGELAP